MQIPRNQSENFNIPNMQINILLHYKSLKQQRVIQTPANKVFKE